jgi:polysaccharide biosynthesis protein PslH
MAMRKAIVSTSVGCEGLRVKDGENIMIADAPQEFADKVISALKDDNQRRLLEDNARRLAEEYDWRYLCELQEVVYKEAMGRKATQYSRKPV